MKLAPQLAQVNCTLRAVRYPWCRHSCRTRTCQPVCHANTDKTDEAVPSLSNGIDWYCYSALALLGLADLTPVGAAISASDRRDTWLAVVQWGGFVLPTAAWVRSRGWSWRATFKLRPCAGRDAAAALLAGAGLWAAVTLAIAAKQSGPSALGPLGSGHQGPAASELASLLLLRALLPAVAEEVLFRGLLLTSIQQRLGRVDSVALCGVLFAALHLDLQQFFALSLLGFAAGGAATLTGSILPAVALHLGYNAAALTASSVQL